VWIFVPVRPRAPTGKPAVTRSCERHPVVWAPGGLRFEAVGWRPPHRPAAPTPSSPSPGRRRELPRGVDLRCWPAPDASSASRWSLGPRSWAGRAGFW